MKTSFISDASLMASSVVVTIVVVKICFSVAINRVVHIMPA